MPWIHRGRGNPRRRQRDRGQGAQPVIVSTVSSGRAGCVRRLLDSLRTSAEQVGTAAPDLQIVLDSSDGDAETRAIRFDARTYAESTGRRAAVFSYGDRSAFVERLVARLPDRPGAVVGDALRFALLGDRELPPAVGAARNCEALLEAGSIVISIDDDVVARGGRPSGEPHASGRTQPPAPANAATTGGAQPPLTVEYADGIRDIECTFYADRDALLDAVCLDPIDVVDLARKALSAPSGHGTIDLAVFGTAGDGGIGHRHFILADQVSVVAADGSDWPNSRDVFEGREFVRVAQSAFTTRHPFYMTGAAALQCANLLPPFFPNGMPEDGLFGAMLTRLYDDSVKAHVPVALFHDAPPEDHLTVTSIDDVGFSLCRVVRVLLGTFRPGAGPRSARLSEFGRWLQAQCDRPADEFAGWVESVIRSSLESYAGWLRDRYSQARLEPDPHGDPTRLDRAVRGLTDHLDDRINTEGTLPITDFAGLGLTPADQYTRMQRMFALYGCAIEWWPAIVQVASDAER